MPKNLLQMHQGSLQFGSKVIFEQASFSINDDEHVGVIGPNGAGKTSLFRILVGEQSLDSGDLIKTNGLRIGYLAQESDWNVDSVVEDFLAENSQVPLWKIKKWGEGLGLLPEHFQTKMKTLSGGYRMRVQLLYIMGQEPDLMLLDEPTNFLDLESLLVLETFLQEYPSAFMVISHDREFLKKVATHILEVEGNEITKFNGTIEDYFEQKAELQEMLQRQAMNLEVKKKAIQDFVDRFRAKATKAKQAQSRLKQLQKMDTIELKALPVRSQILIPTPARTGKEILQIENGSLGYGDKTILNQINLRFERGDHVGIVGYNGAGKSTLLKGLSQLLPLKSGKLQIGYQAEFGYFAQHSSDSLLPEETVIEALQRASHFEITQQEILNLAGSLLFSGENIKKKIKVLSGGEKSRVALGQILLQKKPCLLLDEPTNHLDFDTVEALTQSLQKYEGTIVVISHDRSFIRRVSTKILEIKNGQVQLYPGTYDEYIWSVEKGVLSIAEAPASPTSPQLADTLSTQKEVEKKFNFKEERKKLESEIRENKKQFEKIEALLKNALNEQSELTEKLFTLQGPESKTASQRLGEVSKSIGDLEEKQMDLLEKIVASENRLEELLGS